MDGITLAREIRRRHPIPLIFLSSTGEILTGSEVEFFRFQVPKPIKHSQLHQVLMKIAGIVDPSATKSREKKLDSLMAIHHPLNILLTEDNAVNQKVQLLMLSRLGYKADLAVNGLQAVEAVVKKSYDVVLMDIQMPEMNGVDALRIMRRKPGWDYPAIFALTAEDLAGDYEKVLGIAQDRQITCCSPINAIAGQLCLSVE
jgi:CheY-like chemotaxis protein